MIRKLILILPAMLLALSSFGQNDKIEIRKTFEEYSHAFKQKNYEKVVNFLYPKIFEYIPKDLMLKGLKNMESDPGTITTMDSFSVTNISEIFQWNGIKYALINYRFKMTIVENPEKSESKEDEFDVMDAMYKMLILMYGKENVVFDKENNKFEINGAGKMYAIYDPAYKGWKFIEKKDKSKSMLLMILPEEVLEKL